VPSFVHMQQIMSVHLFMVHLKKSTEQISLKFCIQDLQKEFSLWLSWF
jgi:hypothetical protein